MTTPVTMSAGYFDAMYQAAADPWGFEDRWYEQRKYAISMAAVPVTGHGTTLTGTLIAQSRYFSELAAGNPLMSALEPASGLLGQEYAKEAEAEFDHHLHVRAASIRGDAEAAEGPWRISLEAVDG